MQIKTAMPVNVITWIADRVGRLSGTVQSGEFDLVGGQNPIVTAANTVAIFELQNNGTPTKVFTPGASSTLTTLIPGRSYLVQAKQDYYFRGALPACEGIQIAASNFIARTVKNNPLTTSILTAITGRQTRPSYNTGNGFFVLNGQLYDSNGNLFIPFGTNQWNGANPNSVCLPIVAETSTKLGCNAIRFNGGGNGVALWYQNSGTAAQRQELLTAAINNKIISWFTIQDTTAVRDYDMPFTQTQNGGRYGLKQAIDYWLAEPGMMTLLQNNQQYAILNPANEWGSPTAWKQGCIDSITRLRAAGYTGCIQFDVGEVGQGPFTMINDGQAVFDADPQKNVIFSVHIYGAAYDKFSANNSWEANFWIDDMFPRMFDTGLCWNIGEFQYKPGEAYEPSYLIPYMYNNNIGHFFWGHPDWVNADIGLKLVNTSDFKYNSPADLTPGGRYLIEHPVYAYRKWAKPCTIFN